MKFGPLTFQCACLQCNCRSTASARHALHNSMSWTRFVSDKSIPVAYILVLVLFGGCFWLLQPPCHKLLPSDTNQVPRAGHRTLNRSKHLSGKPLFDCERKMRVCRMLNR